MSLITCLAFHSVEPVPGYALRSLIVTLKDDDQVAVAPFDAVEFSQAALRARYLFDHYEVA
ncbi:MAG: hypothetical protein WCP01_15660 [Methylococcaceae bacterium]